MADPVRSVESIGLELAALRVENEWKANLIVRLADALYVSRAERDLLGVLQSEIEEVSAWAASLR